MQAGHTACICRCVYKWLLIKQICVCQYDVVTDSRVTFSLAFSPIISGVQSKHSFPNVSWGWFSSRLWVRGVWETCYCVKSQSWQFAGCLSSVQKVRKPKLAIFGGHNPPPIAATDVSPCRVSWCLLYRWVCPPKHAMLQVLPDNLLLVFLDPYVFRLVS